MEAQVRNGSWVLVFCCVMMAPLTLSSQTPPHSDSGGVAAPSIRALRATEVITVDGVLQEQIWQRAGFSDFKQKRPFEGEAPSQRTEVWVAYDDEALYVAARMYDTAPDSIMRMLARRDQDPTADWFAFYVDPYHDHRTGNYFSLSVSGSVVDGTLYNDDWDDNSWDGVWEGKSHIDDKGWTAEMRIPFSQLRFKQQDAYVWGVNFRRSIGRFYERDFVVYTPNKESGFVSRFLDLVGLEHITPARGIEVLPYVTTRAEFLHAQANDPFNSGSKYLPGLGADFKMGLGSNLTLDGTINPDFGQVEVDPAVVNLSDVETFYQEKRPFFIEGANTFSFGQGGSNDFWGFNWGNPNFFYSRRIGRAPQGGLPSHDYAEVPTGVHILGAGKLTGKIIDGWNVGMVHAVTSREYANLESEGVRSTAEIEPLTYYGIARAQRDFNDGRQGFGLITTLTSRSLTDAALRDQLNSSAFVVGMDGWTFLDSDKSYVITGWGGLTNVHGSVAHMTVLQRSSRHYFQRPDAKRFQVDSAATSMTGYAGRFTLNKQKGSVLLNAAIGFIDPRFEINDLGFIWRTDVVNYHIAGGHKWTDPTSWYNSINLMFAAFGSTNFDGDKIWSGYWTSSNWTLPSFYSMRLAYAYNPYSYDARGTRGGPVMLNPIGWEVDLSFGSDSRKSIVVEMFGMLYQGGGGKQVRGEVNIQFKPMPNLSVTVGPSLNRNKSEAQWVGSYTDPTAARTFGTRYVFADFNQTELSATIRLDWTFTPELSLQLFAQPLISSGAYTNLKSFLAPRTFDFQSYGANGSTIKAVHDVDGGISGFEVDADGQGPSAPYAFGNPDFSFKSLRGNAVLRWEFRPGSALYLVWTQSRSDSETLGEFQFNRSFSRLWQAKPDNIFMLKFTYWWPM